MKDWKFVTLGEICSFENGDRGENYPSKSIQTISGIPFINAGHLNESGINFSSMNYIPRQRFELLKKGKIQKDDILFCLRGSLGKVASVGSLSEGAIASSLVIIRSSSVVLNKFLLAYFQSNLCAEMIQLFRNGAAQPNLSAANLKKFRIPLPPLTEQKRIVAILDEAFEGIDRAIANTEKNLANSRELFESYLNAIFTKRDSIPTVAIGDIGEVFDGPHATPKTIDFGPIFLGISSLLNGTIKLEKTRHVSPEDFQKWTRRVKPRTEDIVFSYETRIGQAAIIPEGLECCLGRRMGLVRVDKTKIEPLYFLYLYLSPPFQSFLNEKIIRGATVDRISIKEFPSFTIPLPSLDKQKSIVSTVNLLSTETQRLETIYRHKLAALNELKQSILQKAFTGELTADRSKIVKEEIAA